MPAGMRASQHASRRRRRRAEGWPWIVLAVAVVVLAGAWLVGRGGASPGRAATASAALEAAGCAAPGTGATAAQGSLPSCASAVAIVAAQASAPGTPSPPSPRSARTGRPRPSASASPAATTVPLSAAAAQVLAVINQARSRAGLPPYTISAGLDSSAAAHNNRMASGCGLSHQCPGEPDLSARETAAGVTWTSAGENIGDGGPVGAGSSAIAQMALTLTQDMLNEKPPSDGHRQNIMSTAFHDIGIAVYRSSSGTVWMTQDFSN